MCRALNFQSVSSRPQHAHNTTVWPSRADNTSTELARSGGSISLERSVSPSTQGDPRCARTLPYTTAGGIVLGNQVGGGGGGWGWGCVNRVVIPLPSLSCRCLYGLCLGSPPLFPTESRLAARARGSGSTATSDADRRVGESRPRSPIASRSTVYNGKGGAGWRRAAFLRIRASSGFTRRRGTVPVRRPSELTSLPRSVASDPRCTGTAYHTMYDGP